MNNPFVEFFNLGADYLDVFFLRGLPKWFNGKESANQCRRCRRCESDSRVGKTPWRKEWHLAPVFLPAKVHGQRSPAGYSPWGCKKLDTTEHGNL